MSWAVVPLQHQLELRLGVLYLVLGLRVQHVCRVFPIDLQDNIARLQVCLLSLAAPVDLSHRKKSEQQLDCNDLRSCTRHRVDAIICRRQQLCDQCGRFVTQRRWASTNRKASSGCRFALLASLVNRRRVFSENKKQPVRADRRRGVSHTRTEVALVKSRQIHDTLGEKSLVWHYLMLSLDATFATDWWKGQSQCHTNPSEGIPH